MEENYNNKTDLLFRRKLGEEEATPPDFTWPAIERKLDKPSRKPGAWIWWLSGVFLLIGISGTSFYYSDFGKKYFADNKKSVTDGWNYNTSSPDMTTYVDSSSKNASKTSSASAVSTDHRTDSVKNNSASSQNVNVTNTNDFSGSSVSNNTSGNITPNSNSPQPKKADPKKHDQIVDRILHPENYVDHSGNEERNANNDKHDHSSNNSNSNTHSGNDSVNPQLFAHSDTNTDQDADPKISAQTNDNAQTQYEVIVREPLIFFKPIAASLKPRSDIPSKDDLSLLDEDAERNQPHELPAPPPSADALPRFFTSVNGTVSQQRIANTITHEDGFTSSDIALYHGEDSAVTMKAQTFNYGARFGWFVTPHFALSGGAFLNGYEVNSPGRYVIFNYLNHYDFNIHTATATVQLPSDVFAYPDVYNYFNDTVVVKLRSSEKYSFVNLQLGGSWYPWRTRYFGTYINVLANGALLNHQQVTVTSVKSGKFWEYSGEALQGMNKFTLGLQTGIGFEFTPIRNLGIWIEPAFFTSGAINSKNSFMIHPQAMRYQAGLSFHF